MNWLSDITKKIKKTDRYIYYKFIGLEKRVRLQIDILYLHYPHSKYETSIIEKEFHLENKQDPLSLKVETLVKRLREPN